MSILFIYGPVVTRVATVRPERADLRLTSGRPFSERERSSTRSEVPILGKYMR